VLGEFNLKGGKPHTYVDPSDQPTVSIAGLGQSQHQNPDSQMTGVLKFYKADGSNQSANPMNPKWAAL
jgi:hypothetical protein